VTIYSSEDSICLAELGKEAPTKHRQLLRTRRSETTMKSTHTIPITLRTAQQTTESTRELQEQIRCRAYELYEQRGRAYGHELDDWLQTESEMIQQKANRATV
jgi:uncharacterized protein YchJ